MKTLLGLIVQTLSASLPETSGYLKASSALPATCLNLELEQQSTRESEVCKSAQQPERRPEGRVGLGVSRSLVGARSIR